MATVTVHKKRESTFSMRRVEMTRSATAGAGKWSTPVFAREAVVIGLLIAAGFGIPIALVANSIGQAGLLWVCIPHLLFASMLLGGILSGLFVMDSFDDEPSSVVRRRGSGEVTRPGTAVRNDPSQHAPRQAA